MTWTTPAQLREQVEHFWTRGHILKALVDGGSFFPRRLMLTTPASNELASRFSEVRVWLQAIRGDSHYRLVERRMRFLSVGDNEFPIEAWIDSEDAAASWLGKKREIKIFRGMVEETSRRHPSILSWLSKKPIPALMLAESWNRLLNVVDWCLAHPRPGIYLRQVDIPGIDTKFIESHKGTLYDLLNLALQTNVIVASATGVSHFNQRFGFRDKPERVRFRVLDPILSPLPDLLMNDQDFTVTSQGFSKITPSPLRVFVTENEVNFLAFPPYHGAWVIFGAGYGFDALKDIEWLKKCDIYYWGDIDTHGFAALDQFRADFPDARSLLMDSATLLQHSAHWVEEHQQTIRILSRLTVDEQRLFEELCCGRWGKSIRLEQEKISMQCLLQSLAMLEPVIQ